MNRDSRLRQFWNITTMVVIFQLLVVQAMATWGAFHQHVHHDCDEPDHHCAVTLVLSGGYQNEVPDVVPVEVRTEKPEVPVTALVASDSLPSHLVGGILAHAPPRAP